MFATSERPPERTATHSDMSAEPVAQILSGRAGASGGVAVSLPMLEVVEGLDKGKRFRLEKRRQTLGAPGSDLVLQDPTLRKNHIRLGVILSRTRRAG